jgi:hypothetical protein
MSRAGVEVARNSKSAMDLLRDSVAYGFSLIQSIVAFQQLPSHGYSRQNRFQRFVERSASALL